MDVYQNMDGKYWRTCNGDITSSEGWFRKIMLLGLVNLVPVFGQMTVQGYAYEWAHKAAWGVSSPMPGKIYGRVGSKMLRWGWFALVITFLFLLVPNLLSAISDSLSTSAAATSTFWAHTSGASFGYTVKTVLSFLLSVAALVALVLNAVMAEVGIMRMVVYDKLGAGFQLQAIWKMMKQDATGLLRVVGMAVLFTCVVMALTAAIALVVLSLLVMVAVLGGAGSLIGSSAMSGAGSGSVMSTLGPVLVMVGTLAVPVLLVLAWVYSCGCVWVSLLTARGMGYWTAQFCVAHWGTQDDPLPFEQPGYEQNRARWQQEHWQAQQQATQAARAQQPDAQQPEAQQPEAQAAEAQEPEAQAAEVQEPEARAPEAAEQSQAGSDEAVEPDAVEEPAGQEPAEQGGPAEEDVIEVEAEPEHEPEREPEAEHEPEAAEPAPAAESEVTAAAQPAPAAEPEESASPADAQA